MRACWKVILLIAIGFLCIAGLSFITGQRLSAARSAARRKYPIGITIQEVEQNIQGSYDIHTNSPDTRLPWRYFLTAHKEGLVMQFDQNQKLINVALYTDWK
jgi:hypothetical protein